MPQGHEALNPPLPLRPQEKIGTWANARDGGSVLPRTNMIRRFTTTRGWFRSCSHELELPLVLPPQLPYTHGPSLRLSSPSVLPAAVLSQAPLRRTAFALICFLSLIQYCFHQICGI